MGWLDWYNLIKKYDGILTQASINELEKCVKANPNNPIDSLRLAIITFEAETGKKVIIDSKKLREAGVW